MDLFSIFFFFWDMILGASGIDEYIYAGDTELMDSKIIKHGHFTKIICSNQNSNDLFCLGPLAR